MFVLQKREEPIQWPVKVDIPVDGGEIEEQTFTAHFQLLDQDEIDKAAAEGDVKFIERILVGWGDDVKGPDGKKIPFGEEPRIAMSKIPHIRKAIVRAYYDMANGVARKN